MSEDAVIFGSYMTLLVCAFVFWIIQIIAYWKLFTKAGEPGWKSIIPFYNSYVLFKIAWSAPVGMVFAIASLLDMILSSVTSGSQTEGGIIVGILAILGILTAVLGIIHCFKLSKAYGHGVGFAIGLIFLYPIFILILGLGSSKYVGKQA